MDKFDMPSNQTKQTKYQRTKAIINYKGDDCTFAGESGINQKNSVNYLEELGT